MKKITTILALWLLAALPQLKAQTVTDSEASHDSSIAAEEPLPAMPEIRSAVVDSICSTYKEWKEVSMSGKLSSPMLPITATIKVYMVKDELALISVSAPFIGEVARIEIDPEQIMTVNKWKNLYTTIDMAEIEPLCPGGLSAFQNLLLGRVNMPGSGELTPADSQNLEIYETGDGNLLLLPEQDLENAPYVYYYLLSAATLLPERLTVLTQDATGEVDCDYTWGRNDLTLRLTADLRGKPMEATLKLNTPDASPKKMERMEIISKYTATDLKGLMRF